MTPDTSGNIVIQRRLHAVVRPDSQLVFYNNARTALAKARSVDDVKRIRVEAEQMKAYARVSKDKALLLDATEIRDRAIRMLGRIIKAQAKTVGLAKPGPRGKDRVKNKPDLPTLEEAGISKNLANRARKLGKLSDAQFEDKVMEWRSNTEASEGFAAGDMLADKVRGTQGTGENEWHTPEEHLDLARKVLGTIDLDPASSAVAQRTVQAESYFTAAKNGLTKEWIGKVWLNPPYAQPLIAEFVAKMIEEVQAKRCTEAIMLTHNYTDSAWFQDAARAATAICFTRGRIRFEDPEGNLASPTQGQAFFYFGSRGKTFANVFDNIGFVVELI